MKKILPLDEETIKLLPGGDTIERPADVVRELLENSLDAGANLITIEIKNGGKTYIGVTDNGHGIEDDDIPLIFTSYSTSKIKSFSDIKHINTKGFRGLSLYYISAVAEVELVTKTKDSPLGRYVHFNRGNLLETNKTDCSAGTSISVINLFFNHTEKYKHLKKDAVEGVNILDVIKRFSLEYPHVSFRFINNGSLVVHSPGNNDLPDCISSLYGKKIARHLLNINYKCNNISIVGYISDPSIYFENENNQNVFINGNYLKNIKLHAIINAAYNGLIPPDSYPLAALKVAFNPSIMSFNFEAAKAEVSFHNEDAFFSALRVSIATVLNKFNSGVETVNKYIPSGSHSSDPIPEKQLQNILDKLDIKKQNIFLKASTSIPDFQKPFDREGTLFSKYYFIEQGNNLYVFDYFITIEKAINYKLKKEYLSGVIKSVSCSRAIEADRTILRDILRIAYIYRSMGFRIEASQENMLLIAEIPEVLNFLDTSFILNDILIPSLNLNTFPETNFIDNLINLISRNFANTHIENNHNLSSSFSLLNLIPEEVKIIFDANTNPVIFVSRNELDGIFSILIQRGQFNS